MYPKSTKLASGDRIKKAYTETCQDGISRSHQVLQAQQNRTDALDECSLPLGWALKKTQGKSGHRKEVKEIFD